MSAQAPDNNVFVEDIVTALTGPVDATGHATTALKDQMRRAADEFDQRTAEAFARALLESLCAETVDLRRLEALLILGLAHPTILDRHRISLQTEGKRLAAMLVAQGQLERARCLIEVLEQRLGGGDPLDGSGDGNGVVRPEVEAEIETYLKRADQCAALGRNAEAIRWLQEIVTLDRNRRDVARMIRDLRWSEKERQERNVKRIKVAGVLLVVAALLAGVFVRESYIETAYRDLPVPGTDLPGLRERLASLDALVAGHKLWFGMGTVLREQTQLGREISNREAAESESARKAALEIARRAEDAESARARGMQLAQQGHFEEALADLRQSLQLADPSWPDRAQVQANVEAIEAWMKKSR